MTSFAEIIDRTTADELRARGSWKWAKGGPGVIGAFVAEMDFGVARPVEEALLGVIERRELGYLSQRASDAMAAACARWQRERYGWEVDPERVRPLPDVITGLAAAISVFSRPGSPVILPTPAYMPFLTWPATLGREIIQVPMAADGGRYVLDLDGIAAAFKRGGHLLVLCNPSNPVGRVYGAEELAAVAGVVEANGGRVFADEIHAPLLYPGGRHIPYASLSEATARHTVTGTAASKGWNLPGLKCAQLVLSNDADAVLWAERGFTFEHGTSTPGAWAAAAAYRDGGDWLADVVGYLDGSRLLLAELLAARLPEIGYRPPAGTYLAWLDCRGLFAARGIEENPADFFLERGRVLLTDGAACGDAGQGHVRLNFATPRPILAEMVRRLADAVNGR
ncbi:aminotransferase class I/II-fold pyridoxal phosphate-dependent enzyme [Trebonia kvetii]|uniref:cysteine-S-conjugate beta-lyase n=1 Tax=Trebonia kvetii TaxID=2480626 RepID=A0A6P2BVS6_9ACTN|nr:aminotransferase class I/II-fold pyridoxal phosphate-dependent enzyme [Trebonia kvetii]TVZ03028.1 aminotransferase class I/II-fold pyridoxal phosphate-dependent enzyme [Trebonia kvetii]